MFESIVDKHERGQVGIGTLIVFIAMVLVAAIAAGVLINTAGVLQTQASDTGSETQEAVANQIEVTHAAGHVNGDVIDQVDMTLMKSAGSNAIDLEAMTVQYTSSSTDATLTHDATSDDQHFETEKLAGDNDGTSLTATDDRVKLILNTAALENTGGGSDGSGTLEIGTGPSINDVSITSQPTGDGNIQFTVSDTNTALTDEVLTITGTTIQDQAISGGDTIAVQSDDFNSGDSLEFILKESGGTEIGSETTGQITTGVGLKSGTSATVKLIDQSGAQFTYGISVPSTFGNKKVVSV